MKLDTGIIKVVQLDSDGNRAALIEIPSSRYPIPGNYILGYNLDDSDQLLGIPLFQVDLPKNLDKVHKPTLGSIPNDWIPGTRLKIKGPIGNGFRMPKTFNRISLVSISGSIARLLPLLNLKIQAQADISIFTAIPPNAKNLPPSFEVHPLSDLPENLTWPNFLVIDLPLPSLHQLRNILGLRPHEKVPCETQILIQAPMPCGGYADCGVCAVPSVNRGYQFVCVDGPVFDLNELIW